MSNSNGKSGPAAGPLELPILKNLPTVHPCHDCGHCCTYLAIEIDAPTGLEDHEHIHWYLTHRGVSVYVDWESDWFVEFQTVCEHLTDKKTCGIYEDRPKICSDFSWDECEKTTGERAWKYRFLTPDDYIEWHREKRPKSYGRFLKARARMKRRRERKNQESETEQAKSGAVAKDQASVDVR